ncbi:GRXC6, partial [Linum grandiflorum]
NSKIRNSTIASPLTYDYKSSKLSDLSFSLSLPPLVPSFLCLPYSLSLPMQGLELCSNDDVCLHLTPPPPPTTTSASLSIDAVESPEDRIQRLISENPVIIFSRSSCSMCHVMKKLLATIGVNPTVIELEDHEISALPPPNHSSDDDYSSPPLTANNHGISRGNQLSPSVFIGGTCVGGLESLVGLHLSGLLVPKLVQVGALWIPSASSTAFPRFHIPVKKEDFPKKRRNPNSMIVIMY